VSGGYDAAQRNRLEHQLAAGLPLRCPACDVELTQQRVEQPAAVSYVRRRVWVLCPVCRRTASLDVLRR
jgi:uncharacterized protein with PIN domain